MALQQEVSPNPPILEEAEPQSEAGPSEAENEEGENAAEAQEPPPQADTGVDQPTDPPIASPIAKKNNSEAEAELTNIARRDLTAQQSMAESTAQMVVVAWVAAFLTAAGVGLIVVTVRVLDSEPGQNITGQDCTLLFFRACIEYDDARGDFHYVDWFQFRGNPDGYRLRTQSEPEANAQSR